MINRKNTSLVLLIGACNMAWADEKVGAQAPGSVGLASGWSGYLEGRNLFDTRYISNTAIAGTANEDSALYNPGAGRALYAGVRLNW